MGLFNKLKKSDNKVEPKSISEESEYMLSSVKKENIENNSFSVALNSLININSEFNDYVSAFNSKSNKNNELCMISGFTGASEVIEFFKDPNNRAKVKDLKKLGFNPATIMITIALSQIERDLGDIKEISNNILSFLENEKQSEIQGDVKTLNRAIVDYKYNYDDEQYIDNYSSLMIDIKRTANKNIESYKNVISDEIKKKSLFMTNKTIDSNQNKLEKDFSYYRLSLYIYSFASFMEIMLMENFKKEYLMSRKEELELLSKEYKDNYDKAYDFIKEIAGKSVQSNLLSGIGSAGKAIGDLTEKVQMIKDKNIDDWFNKNGDNLKNMSQDMKDKFITKFEEMSNPNIKLFIDKIELISNIYNNTKNIYFDKEKVYLEMVK